MNARVPSLDAAEHYEPRLTYLEKMAREEAILRERFRQELLSKTLDEPGTLETTSNGSFHSLFNVFDGAVDYDDFAKRIYALFIRRVRNGDPDEVELFDEIAAKWASMNAEVQL